MNRWLLLMLGGWMVVAGTACQPRPKDQVCFEKRCVNVELARTPEEQTRGLQFRKRLGHNQGMLFIFPRSCRARFWMKDTWIPLDMIWMDEHRKVIHIEARVAPCQTTPCPTYGPSQPAMYVLEVNAGYAEELGIRPGYVAEFRFAEGL